MQSIWEETARQPGFPALERDIHTDVLIIGGGMCGLLCAYGLHQAGVDYALVEAETLCSGITKNTTAKITSQHGLIYHQILSKFGPEAAKQYYRANEDALREYYRLSQKIDCDFQWEDSYVYATDGDKKLNREMEALEQLGIPGSRCDTLPLPMPVSGAVKFPHQGQFHPLKFAAGISRGLHVHEHTRVRELIGTKAVTTGGTIQAKRILVTTHFPFINKHGFYFMKLYQHRSYVIALKHTRQAEGMYVDEAQKGMSFRNYGDLLLLGGGNHRTGKKGGSWQELRRYAKLYYPEAVEVAHWATQDCMSLDGVPYIGPYSAGTEGLYVATGFNKWGMTTSMAAAKLLTDMVQGKENPNRAVFSPSRAMLHPQLAINAWEAMTDFLIPTTKRCPHLGCALRWNPYEHTWDCPCHGSRFTKDGKLIDNPATGNLK